VSDDAAASMEMSRYVAAHVRTVDFKDLRAGVVGLGPAGLIALQMVKAMGAREVVGIDLLPERLELARKLGATQTVNPSDAEDMRKLEEIPLQASVDCSGAAAGLQVALDHTRGGVVIFGVVHGNASFSTRHWFQGTYIPKRTPPGKADTDFVLDLWRKGRLDTESLISIRLPFEDYAKGIRMLMERKAIRVCYYPA